MRHLCYLAATRHCIACSLYTPLRIVCPCLWPRCILIDIYLDDYVILAECGSTNSHECQREGETSQSNDFGGWCPKTNQEAAEGIGMGWNWNSHVYMTPVSYSFICIGSLCSLDDGIQPSWEASFWVYYVPWFFSAIWCHLHDFSTSCMVLFEFISWILPNPLFCSILVSQDHSMVTNFAFDVIALWSAFLSCWIYNVITCHFATEWE